MNDQPITLSRRESLKLIALATTATALAPTAALANLLKSQDTILPWTQISPGFHALVDLNTGGNALIHATKDAVLLIDTKFPYLAGAMLKDANSLSIADQPPLTLINTHHHNDHTAGNALVLPHAKNSYAHSNAIPRIQSQLGTAQRAAKSAPDQAEKYINTPALNNLAKQAADASDNWTKDDITPANPVNGQANKIVSGETAITLHHFGPGHTDNDLVVHFENDNVIHTGDLVFSGLHPFFDPSAAGSTLGWLLALNQSYNLCDKDTKVIPGHGEPGDRSIIQKQMDYLTKLFTNIQTEITKGTPKEEIAKMQWDFMDGLGFESIRERAINAVYDELSE